jgi:hypothetical protein
MYTYETTLVAENGKESLFSMQLDKAMYGLEGTMNWDGDSLPVKNVNYYAEGYLYCTVFWLGVWMRTWIVASFEDAVHQLSIRIAGNSFSFRFLKKKEGYDEYIAFLKSIKEKNSWHTDPIPPRDFEQAMDMAVIRQTAISLYEGSNIHKNLRLRFLGCAIDGVPVSVDHPKPLPQQLGTYIPVGYFEPESVIKIQWAFETFDVPESAMLSIGVFRNGKLSDRTPLQTYSLQRYQVYKGWATVKI